MRTAQSVNWTVCREAPATLALLACFFDAPGSLYPFVQHPNRKNGP